MSFIVCLAVSLAFVWMLLTSQFNLQGFVVGLGISLTILTLFRPGESQVNWRRLPGQILALLYYLVILYINIFLSGLDIARRVLSPKMRINPGVIAVPVQDPERNSFITALSADAISLTPGELVTEIEDNSIMYVHTLDVERTASRGASEQADRLRLLNRIMGRN
jgi:multicomponent Na+:H+ antiporter subunit E